MRLINRVAACVVALALAVPPLVPAQTGPAPAPFKAEELDQLVAPIALYPDPLVAQILMASTYPLEVVQAARFVKENPKLTGDPLDQALKKQTWDDSVKSLTTFPQVLSMMDGKLDWTQKLGDAFLAQQKEVMDAVQRLRARAQAAGNLKSTAEQTVTVEPAAAAAPAPPAPPPPPVAGQPPQQVVVQQAPPTVITIAPANPQVVYVPTYNPTVVYGAWPYPAYPPYSYYPPGYVAGAALFSFAAGVAVGSALWGNCNWHGGDVNVNVNQYNSYTKNVNTTNVANKRTEIQGSGGRTGSTTRRIGAGPSIATRRRSSATTRAPTRRRPRRARASAGGPSRAGRTSQGVVPRAVSPRLNPDRLGLEERRGPAATGHARRKRRDSAASGGARGRKPRGPAAGRRDPATRPAPEAPPARRREPAAVAGAPSRVWARVGRRRASATEGRRVARAWARPAGGRLRPGRARARRAVHGEAAGDEDSRTRVSRR